VPLFTSSGLGLDLKNLILITSLVSCASGQGQTVPAFQRPAC